MRAKLLRVAKTGFGCAGILWGVLGFWQTTAQALPSANFEGEVEYAVPVTDATLKPYSKFFVSRFEVSQDEDLGTFSINLTLPRDLSGGREINVNLDETGRQGNKISFTNDIGTADCDVPADWDTAKCVYIFNSKLRDQVPRAKAKSYLENKYKGDQTLAARKKVVLDNFFSVESTESIGEAFPKAFACESCIQGNGVWETEYTTADGTLINAEMELSRTKGHYFNTSGSGSLSNVKYDGNTATGTWKYGTSVGWFRFRFEDGQFNGEWGVGALGESQRGTWIGYHISD